MIVFEDKRFVNRDIESIRKELYEKVKTEMSAWTDFNSDTFESHIIDLVAGLSDMLGYYIDNSIKETRLMEARQEKNIRGNLQTMNYFVEVISPAKGTVTIKREEISLGTFDRSRFQIPKWSSIRANDESEVNYLTTEVCQFLPDDMEKEVPVVQGDILYKEVKVSALKKNYKYYVTGENVPIEWVFIDDMEWEKVEDAFVEIGGGKKYSVHKDSRNRVYIMFTYDWKNYLSKNDDDKVRISYVRTLGTKGLVRAYTLSTLMERIYDEEGEEINNTISIANKEQTYGAYDSVDLNLHKANAKLNLKTMDRIILREDFQAKVIKEGWVLACTVFDWRRDITIVPEPFKMVAWVVTTDGVDTNQKVLDQLRDKLMKITVEMTKLEIRCAEYVNIPIRMNICVKGNNDYRESVRSQVEKNIEEFYDVKNLKFGQVISIDDVEDIATRTANTVRFPEVTSFTEPFILSPIQFPNITQVEVSLVGDSYGQKTDY